MQALHLHARRSTDGGGMAISPTQPWLALARFWDVEVIDLPTGRRIAILPAERSRTLAWSPSGDALITAGDVNWTETLATWAMPAGTPLASLALPSEGRVLRTPEEVVLTAVPDHVLDLSWSPTGDVVAIVSALHPPRLYDPRAGTMLARLLPGDGAASWRSTPLGLAWSPRGAEVAVTFSDGTTAVWASPSGTLLAELHGKRRETATTLSSLDTNPTPVTWSPDGARIAVAADDSIQLWDAGTGSLLKTSRSVQATSHPYDQHSTVSSVAFVPDGHHVVAALGRSVSRLALIWDTETDAVRSLDGGPFALPWSTSRVALSANGSRLLVESSLSVIQGDSWRPVASLGGARTLATSRDLEWIATYDLDVRIWHLDTARRAAGGQN
jgi:WD40 repeat protein